MIDKSQQPEIKEINQVDFVAPKEYKLSENCSLFHMKEVTDDTVRLDLYFDAGKIRGTKSIANFVNGLLLSGTKDKTSEEINEEINGLGGFYNGGVSAENAVITLYCLRENLMAIFDTILDAIKNVEFPEKDVKEFLSDLLQGYKIGNEKVSVLAQRAFQKELFSSDSNYSNILTEKDIEDVTIDDMKKFHQEYYLKGLTKIVVVGDIEEREIILIQEKCRDIIIPHSSEFATEINNNAGEFIVDKKDAIQSAIRVGRMVINKKHEDYIDFLILNTILGDYFGSRLMTNIREDKGYTYGIGSFLAELNHVGYFIIATEVKSDVKDATITEIKKEFKRLQEELVPEDELNLVKNYMLGQLLKSADGPYAMMDLFLSVESHQMPLDFYNVIIKHLHAISPERIKEIANKHLNWEDFTVVVAG